jgi:hypothetical protein|tara:strand:- start:5225 stop:6001 length:777 start_codon:yes stop_codon:yes gene_type:complete
MDPGIMEVRYGLIDQTCGIGDIFYLQKIAKLLIERGLVQKIIWPVKDVYGYLNDYMGTDKIKYIPLSQFDDPTGLFDKGLRLDAVKIESFNTHGPTHWIYIPFTHADKKFSGSVMKAKYKFANMEGEWEDWDDYFDFKRDPDTEYKLFKHLGISRLDDYVIVSGTYGTPPATASRRVEYSGDKKVVKLEAIEGFSVFDWCAVFENAAEIHMIETCFIYILEKLNLKGNVFNLYSKWNPAFWDHIKHIPKKVKWNYCDW